MLWLIALLALSACAPLRQREDAGLAQIQAQREAQLRQQSDWSLRARIAVSNGDDGGSGELEWQQHGERYDFTVHAPVTGKTWHLHGDAQTAILEGVEPQPLIGTDPAALLRERVGWIVPLRELTAWVRALRAVPDGSSPASRAQLSYNDRSLPAVLQQDGWTVEYKDYFDDLNPALPRKVFAARPPYRVRMAIERWSLDP